MKVIVVGSGAAGLVAARSLHGAGFDVTVLEKEGVPGGRTAGAEREGFLLDLGAQFFTRYYDTTFEVCREAGLGGEMLDYHLRSLAWRNQRMYPLEMSRDPRVALRGRGYQCGGMRERLGLARLLAWLSRHHREIAFADMGALGELDRQSLSEFALRRFGSDVLEYYLQPSASSLSCAQPEDMCAANGISLAWHIISGLFKGFVTLERGLGSLVEALARDCGGHVECSTPARRVVIEGGAVKGVETDGGFEAGGRGGLRRPGHHRPRADAGAARPAAPAAPQGPLQRVLPRHVRARGEARARGHLRGEHPAPLGLARRLGRPRLRQVAALRSPRLRAGPLLHLRRGRLRVERPARRRGGLPPGGGDARLLPGLPRPPAVHRDIQVARSALLLPTGHGHGHRAAWRSAITAR